MTCIWHQVDENSPVIWYAGICLVVSNYPLLRLWTPHIHLKQNNLSQTLILINMNMKNHQKPLSLLEQRTHQNQFANSVKHDWTSLKFQLYVLAI